MEKRAFLFEKWLAAQGMDGVVNNPSLWSLARLVQKLSRKGKKKRIFDPMASVSSTPAAMYDAKTKSHVDTVLKTLGMGAGVGAASGAATSAVDDAMNGVDVDSNKLMRSAGLGASLGVASPFIGGELGALINKLTTKKHMGKPTDHPGIQNVRNILVDYTVGGGYNAGVYTAPVLAGLFAGTHPSAITDIIGKINGKTKAAE